MTIYWEKTEMQQRATSVCEYDFNTASMKDQSRTKHKVKIFTCSPFSMVFDQQSANEDEPTA